MTVLASWSGDGLTDGTAVSTSTTGSGDTAFTTVTSGAVTVDDSGLHAPRLQVDQAASTAAELIWGSTVVGTTLTEWAARVYVELSDWPPSNGGRLLSAYTASNTLLWFCDLTTAGLMRLRNAGGSAVDTSDAALTADTELRIEAVHDNGSVTVNVYTGDGTTVLTSVSATGLGTGSALEALRFGMPATSPTWPTFWLDEMALSDAAAEIGPVPAPPAPTPPAPRFPLQDRYELLLDGEWTDVTGYVYDRDPVTISRGRSAEADSADPCKMTLTLDNRDGRFSPRNPLSLYYGTLGRNTQIRASIPSPTSYLVLPDAGTGYAEAPDSAALSITGDLDVRIEADLDDWTIDADLIGKALTTGSQISWALFTRDGGLLQLFWSVGGSTTLNATSTATLGTPSRARMAVRVTLDVDNGSSGYTAAFYTADTIDGAWTQLGDAVTGTGTTSIFDSSAPVQVGKTPSFTFGGRSGRVYAAEILDGIDGTLVASPDFTGLTAGDTSFDDDQSNTWTLKGSSSVGDRMFRFQGEVASWPTTWDKSGSDAYVKITAAGIKRRLTQNAPTLRSSMFREFANPARQNIVAYWPMEDGAEATQVAAATNNVAPLRVSGAVELGSDSEWTASDALPTMGTGTLTGLTPPHTATGEVSVRLFVWVKENPSAETSLLQLGMSGATVYTWDVRLTTTGGLRTRAYDRDGTSVLDSTLAITLDSMGFTILDLELSQDGSAVDWATKVLDFIGTETVGDSIPVYSDDGTLTGKTLGTPQRITVGRDGGLGQVVVGHLAFADDLGAYAATSAAIRAQNGENPTKRLGRLAAEEEVNLAVVHRGIVSGDFVALGDQRNKTLMDLLEEAADADLGVLYEPRDRLGFAYRTRLSMYNQDAAVTLDYSAKQVMGDLTPVDDDHSTLNDLTVKREAGSSVRVEQTTGPLSTAEPPDGVGRYDAEVSLSLETDTQLPDQAGWRLHLGTTDEARFPQLTVHLRAPGIDDDLADQVLTLDVGDRIVLTGIPEGLPPDDVSLLVQGYTETLRLYEYEIVFNLAPESPWHVGVLETAGLDRLDSDGATLNGDATSTATSLSVASSGPLWTTDTDDMPFDIYVAGERMTVTAVAGTSSPQTFTVTRSVNGVEKAQSSGAAVTIAEPVVVAL